MVTKSARARTELLPRSEFAASNHASAEHRLSFGRMLQYWRRTRGMSQVELASGSHVSVRHVSFLETGRSQPSRDMVIRLASSLQVPLRERNAMLEAAGFARFYRETELAAPELQQANRAIDLILAHQEPYPALVLDRYWNVLRANDGAKRFLTNMLGEAQPEGRPNVVRLVFDPRYLRPWIANWNHVAPSLLCRVRREAVGGVLDDQARALLHEVMHYPGIPDDLEASARGADTGPLVPLHFRKKALALSFFSTVTTLGTPRDISLQELRIECFFPADSETERSARNHHRKTTA